MLKLVNFGWAISGKVQGVQALRGLHQYVALCFGWIDGIRKTIDEQCYKIRFTPRKITSVWSAVNVNKVKVLIQLGKMKPAGMHLFNNRTDAQGYSSEQRNVQLAREYEEQIKANQPAWLFFTNLAPSYKRDSIWWVERQERRNTIKKAWHIHCFI
jgi:uncharacterized protein YdeI (YjbR/CyaY-like superfamily)